MTFRGALVSRGMYMGVSIDQMKNDGYFPTQKDHLHLLEGVSKKYWSNHPPRRQIADTLTSQCICSSARVDSDGKTARLACPTDVIQPDLKQLLLLLPTPVNVATTIGGRQQELYVHCSPQ